jgi:Fe2+ transport system protein FeoA
MGVTRGTHVYVERHAPLGDPVEVSIKGYYLALRMNEAKEIEVEPVCQQDA